MNLFLQITSISYHLDYQHLKRNAISLAHSDGLSLTYSTKTSHPSKEKERATATRRDKQGMATHVAHDVFGYGLQVGKDALTYGKSKPGVVKWTVEKVSGPVCSVLESKIGQTAIKAGDRVISVADGTIDKAMNTGATILSGVSKMGSDSRLEPGFIGSLQVLTFSCRSWPRDDRCKPVGYNR